MTPLSNILTKRSEALSFTETVQRVEQEAYDSIAEAKKISTSVQEHTQHTPSIELSQIKQALLDMRQQIDIIVSALDEKNSAESEATVLSPIQAIEQLQEIEQQLTQHIPSPQPTPRFVYTPKPVTPPSIFQEQSSYIRPLSKPAFINGQQIIQGRFNGQQMIDGNNNIYEVPANYASKSKMVEGDVLKLTITQDGRHYYKQIGPIKRQRVVGELAQDPQGNWVVIAEMTPYRILTASVTFHRARQGDQVVILIPEGIRASWGAVETFLR